MALRSAASTKRLFSHYIGEMTRTDTPQAKAEMRSRIMRAVGQKNTRPELVVRRLLHALGFRFRLHRRDLPGSPDIVLPRHCAAIFVHGCFWHQHADCRYAKPPRSRQEYWLPKLARNVERDISAQTALRALGWRVLVVWQCELRDGEALRARVSAFLRSPE